MKYVSTRGLAPALGFSDVLLAGLARDGGLYVPETWPSFSPTDLSALAGKPYDEIAFTVIRPFVDGEIADADLARMCSEAYATFRHPAVAPLVQTGPNAFILELFHGPTLAFKDVAMQLLARLMDHVLSKHGRRATIVGATSGDTGGAAIEAFRGRASTDVFILFPKGRVSPVQQRQMTTAADANVHAVAVEGTFDDCQAIVKGLFNDHRFRDRVALSGVNSINWARIVAQVVYYVSAALSLGAPARKISFTVPTGNFGDVFAGYVAKKIGLPIDKLIIATNTNDILARALESGRYETTGVVPTQSPSMDIQVSSNFERLLFDATGRDGEAIRRLMDGLGQSGAFTIPAAALGAIREEFAAGRTSEAETAETMRQMLAEAGYLADPHTAVALSVAARQGDSATPMVTLSTAHPAKFPAAVEAATGVRPALPVWLGDLMAKEERFSVLPNDIGAIARFVEARARAVGERVET
ncbi:threonine synthase [Kaistia dalseonensis]|uniref:Threonine synthase n=1 Tax=Kaistia dalseonensis TaxID=410840 RepID=A0ABU0HF09_9HYPH|nr:threonine synthase [Kaistia dalseonensis]MCX5497457.1 threonine synthase [Kaistia dalseonensis]MDQ0440096.1 threonine synthase [Kaistia dalseonensis]